MCSLKVPVQLLEELLEQTQVILTILHVGMDLLDDSLWFSLIKVLPTVIKRDFVAIITTFLEESFHIFEGSLLDKLAVRLVSGHQV